MKNSFFSTNKSSHNVRCTYCGEWMAEEDVFCQNCWKITPKVQEMLTRFPNKKLDDYHPISKRKGYACPHCGSIFEKKSHEKIPGMKLCTPIQYCKKCQNYFLNYFNNEWSITNSNYKNERRFGPWLLVVNEFLLFEFFQSTSWVFEICVLYLVLHFPLCILWHTLTKRKAIIKSNLRLERNPEYPKILADMGYGTAMNKQYQNLITRRYSKITLKEILKDAFTFD